MLGENYQFKHVNEDEQHPVFRSEDIYIFVAQRKNDIVTDLQCLD
jgi:hypothetical protein